jgi:CBS domain-containing protein
MFVDELMTRRPAVVTPETAVKEALVVLDRHQVTSLPVVDGAGRVVGVVSEADLIRDSVAQDRRASILPVSGAHDRPATVADVMSRHAVTVHPRTDLADAVELMTSTSVKSLPVVDERGRILGIVSRSDVVHALARSDETLTLELEDLMGSLGHEEWLVQVEDGVVVISGPGDDKERALARAAAGSVTGVIEVRVD